MARAYRPSDAELPRLRYPADLPIVERREEIVRAIRDHRVVVVCGETGSGKSTQIPKLCLEAGRGRTGRIGLTQPRRIAARSIAARLAEELGVELGTFVGCTVRFHDRTAAETAIKVMTDGILLAETQSDRRLAQYDTIIIDEAHERSLNVDLLLGLLKRLLARRDDLHVVVTSATIDPARFSEHFGGAPVIEVSGRLHPVEMRWRPVAGEDEESRDRDLPAAIIEAIDEQLDPATGCGGDVLVFLPGEREIREIAELMGRHRHRTPDGRALEVIPLFARLPIEQQQRVFAPRPEARRVVLATNVAETSLTVPGIRGVVDAGLARISRYSARSKVQHLPIEPISRASAKQRAGRCGRIAPGVCIRLWSEADHATREEFTPPEIHRTNLAGAILRMKALGLEDVRSFPFVEPPRRAAIRDGFDTLQELGAIDESDELTDVGRRLARIPVDPRLARMLIEAAELDCLTETLVLAAALEIQDPRERPFEKRDAADAAHERFADASSDFTALLNLWNFWQERRRRLSWNQLRRACVELHVSFMRMREWEDLHRQLREVVVGGSVLPRNRKPNEKPATPELVHRALLSGLLANVGRRGEQGEYEGGRAGRFRIFPGSGLFGSTPGWIVAAEIVETTRRWARCVARVEPAWIEHAAAHLVKHAHGEPEWERRGARATVQERTTLWGLELGTRRRALGSLEPDRARTLFIHYALVEDEWDADAPYLRHNRALIAEVRAREAKRRETGSLVDPERIHAFFDARLPDDAWSGAALDRWRRGAEKRDRRLLFLAEEDVVRPHAGGGADELHPDALEADGLRLPLVYTHDPGAEDDGVTVEVPVAALPRLAPARLEWLVPGRLEEKVVALIRGLPKAQRTRFIPAPDWARAAVARLRFGSGSLAEALARALSELGGEPVDPALLDERQLPPELRLNVRIIGENGRVLGQGRDLERLRERFADTSRRAVAQLAGPKVARSGITDWDFGDLPAAVESSRDGVVLRGHPHLEDRGDSVAIVVAESEDAALLRGRAGLRRLFLLRSSTEIRAWIGHLPGIDALRLDARALPPRVVGEGGVDAAIRLRLVDRAFIGDDAAIRDEATFRARLDAGWTSLWEVGSATTQVFAAIAAEHRKLALAIDDADKPAFAPVIAEARAWLDRLLEPDLLVEMPWGWLHQAPRWLAAGRSRIERLRGGGLARDGATLRRIAPLEAALAERRASHERRGIVDRAAIDYRWLLEEWRSTLFAPELGSAVPVSEKRLAEQWARVRG